MSDFTTDVSTNSGIDPAKRVRYSTGLVLGVDEFEQEQAYFIERDRLLTRALHGYGVVWGLAVDFDTTDGAVQVTVAPGLAVEPSGQHVCVEQTQCAVLRNWLARQSPDTVPEREEAVTDSDADGGGNGNGTETDEAPWPRKVCLSVVLRYGTCATDFVPIAGEPCRSEDESRAPSRLADDFQLTLEVEAERPPQVEEHAVRLLGRLWRALEEGTAGGSVLDPPSGTGDGPSLLRQLVESVPSVHPLADATLADLAEAAGVSLPTDADGRPRLSVPPGEMTAALRTLEAAWGRARGDLLRTGHGADPLNAGTGPYDGCQPVPVADDGVVLGTFCLSVAPNGDGGLEPAPTGDGGADPTSNGTGLDAETLSVSTDGRPQLLPTRLLQEMGGHSGPPADQGDDSGGGADGGDGDPIAGREAGGDLTNTYPDPTVAGLRGTPLVAWEAADLGQNDLLAWNGEEGAWRPVSLADLGGDTEPPSDPQTDLTRIVTTSWAHQRTYSILEDDYPRGERMSLSLVRERGGDPIPPDRIEAEFGPPGDDRAPSESRLGAFGLAVGFGRANVEEPTTLTRDGNGLVEAQTLTSEVVRVFLEVTADERGGAQAPVGLTRRFRVTPLALVPLAEVGVDAVDGDLQIVEGVIDEQAEYVRGAVLIVPRISNAFMDEVVDGRFEVELRGDFILDEQGCAIYARYPRERLLSEEDARRAECANGNGVQGGHFESWFQVAFSAEKVVDLNHAELDELTELPHVGSAIAERILEERERRAQEDRAIDDPFTLADTVRGLTRERIADWRGRVAPELPSEPPSE